MKRLMITTAAAAILLAGTGMARAQDGAAIYKDAGCAKCHAMDAKKKGPAVKKIAADFKKQGISGDKAIAKMKESHEADDLKGVKSDADLKAVVNWMLSQ